MLWLWQRSHTACSWALACCGLCSRLAGDNRANRQAGTGCIAPHARHSAFMPPGWNWVHLESEETQLAQGKWCHEHRQRARQSKCQHHKSAPAPPNPTKCHLRLLELVTDSSKVQSWSGGTEPAFAHLACTANAAALKAIRHSSYIAHMQQTCSGVSAP